MDKMFKKFKILFSRAKLSPEQIDCKNEDDPSPSKASTGQVQSLFFSTDSVVVHVFKNSIYVSKCQRLYFQILITVHSFNLGLDNNCL